jgi:hypothetical protein
VRVAAAVLFAVVLVAGARVASAHQTSVKYVDLAIDGASVAVAIKLAPSDVTEAMGLPPEARPAVSAAAAHRAVPAYVQNWLAIEAGGKPCGAETPRARVDDGYLVVAWMVTCDASAARDGTLDELRLDFAAFFALDTRHEAVVRLVAPHRAPVQTIVRAGESPIVLRAGHASSPLAWIRSGMDHIFFGLDHVCFVIALLLVVMLGRGRDGAWHVRALWPTLRATAVVITAFTVAHSLTLIAASLGYVQLPSRWVEAVIALSIAYTAAEDIVRPDVRWRFPLVFAFGLVHGLGFASMLAALLPPTDVVVPLLLFNLGVELGQLAIVAVALPVLAWIARAVGATRYRRSVMPALAAVIVAAGLVMVAERTLL